MLEDAVARYDVQLLYFIFDKKKQMSSIWALQDCVFLRATFLH
jgi:hypothetical protein